MEGKKHIRHSRTLNSFQSLVLPLVSSPRGWWVTLPARFRAANGKIPSRVIAADDRRAKGSSGELTRNRARYNDVLLACWLEFPETSRIS